jgi:ketosteroid isomerase-like protein
MSPEEMAVLDANDAYYVAFARRDLEAMEALWAHGVPVTCVHPGWDAIRGREAVMESWASIFGGDSPHVRCGKASAQVSGDFAWVLCRERIPEGPPLVATNVFVRHDGAWRICHHQAGLVAQVDEAEERPPGASA